MNLASILALVLSNPKAIEGTVNGLVNMFKATTAPTPIIVTPTPAVPGTSGKVTRKPSEAIRQLQGLLNQVVKPSPMLVEDGWLGEKTEKAIQAAIVMLRPYLAMLG